MTHELVLGQIGAAVGHPNAGLHVVEAAAVELEELDEQHAQIEIESAGARVHNGRARVDARVHLEEAHGHEYEAVGADAAGPDLVEVALDEELLEDHDERSEARVLAQVLLDELGRAAAVERVEADVDLELGARLDDLDNGHRGLVEHLDIVDVGDALAYQRLLEHGERQSGPLAEHDHVDVARGQEEARLVAAEHVHVGVRQVVLDHLGDAPDDLVAHVELLEARRYVLGEGEYLVVECEQRFAVPLAAILFSHFHLFFFFFVEAECFPHIGFFLQIVVVIAVIVVVVVVVNQRLAAVTRTPLPPPPPPCRRRCRSGDGNRWRFDN